MTVKQLTAGAFALLLLSTTTARAQQAPTTTTTTTTQTPTTTTTTQTAYTSNWDQYRNIVTGAVGGAWGGDFDSGTWAFDGAYAYMLGGLGFEFIGSFTPDAELTAFNDLAITNPVLSANLSRDNPRVNSYMFNLVAGLPFGMNDTWMPFISGGAGMFQISGGRVDFDLLDDDFDLDFLDDDFEPEFDSDGLVTNFFKDNQFGGNLGVGVLGFFDQVGFRADIRYYTGMGNNEGDNLRFVAQNVKDISYWRSTAGISFRW